MNVIKRILRVLAKIAVGLFVFYLFLAWIVVPVGGKWGIQSQGAKALHHPVKVRSVWFNPFLLRVSLNGLEIRDSQDQLMAGFDHFSVDLSALALFKKLYRVESVILDGLNVRAVLASDGTINLLEGMPLDSAKAAQEEKTADSSGKQQDQGDKESSETATSETLPDAVIDRLVVKAGTISFTDQSVDPPFETSLKKINIEVTGLSTDPAAQAKVTFSAQLDEKGEIVCETQLALFQQPLQVETSFALKNYVMNVLTPYVGKFAGREVSSGKLDLKVNYRIADNTISAQHKLLIQRFDFGQKVESEQALKLPFGLVIGLLEDPQGKINISLPVKGDLSEPDFEYWPLLGKVVRNFFVKLVTKPFTFLASMIGAESGVEDLGAVRFKPGSAELPDEEKEKLNVLVQGLRERPRLTLKVNGSHDPESDWEAIRRQMFFDSYQALRAESERVEFEVLQQLYQRRFGLRALWALVKEYREKHGADHEAKLNEEFRSQLIEHAPADKVALDVLAQTRAQIVYDAILGAGFDKERLSVGANRTVQSSLGWVPLEFTLTVFSSDQEEDVEDASFDAMKTDPGVSDVKDPGKN